VTPFLRSLAGIDDLLRDLAPDRRVVGSCDIEHQYQIMKTYGFAPCSLLGLGLVVLLLGLVRLGRAQEAPPAAPATNAEAKPVDLNEYDLVIINGKLLRPGSKVEATLGNVVDALGDRYKDANIVLSQGLAKVKIADLKLRAGRLADELEGLRVASGDRFVVRGPDAPTGPIDPTTGLPAPANSGAGLFVLQEVPTTDRMVEAFNLGPYLDWLRAQRKDGALNENQLRLSIQEVENIITGTLSEFKEGANGDKPLFEYHSGASLLVVIGSHEAVEIARKIVNALPGMPTTWQLLSGPYGNREHAGDAFPRRYGLAPRGVAPPPMGEGPVSGPGREQPVQPGAAPAQAPK
jgi:hypothetical protein